MKVGHLFDKLLLDINIGCLPPVWMSIPQPPTQASNKNHPTRLPRHQYRWHHPVIKSPTQKFQSRPIAVAQKYVEKITHPYYDTSQPCYFSQ